MKRTLAFLAVAATAATLTAASASAQNGAWQNGQQYNDNWQNWNHNGWNNNYDSRWNRQGWNNGYHGWNSRSVSGQFRPGDLSYDSDARYRTNPNRCTEDLGYGRYEYCGW